MQREDRQIGRDDDGDGVKHRPLNLVSCFTDLSNHRLVRLAVMTQMADDVLHHHHGAFDDHAEVQGAKAQEIGGDVAQVETDGGEEQSEWNRDRDDQGSAQIAEEQEQDKSDEKDAYGQVIQNGARCELEQSAAIEEWHDLHAGRKDVVVQFLDLGVNTLQCGVRVVALLQQDDALHYVAVVDQLSIFAAICLSDLAEPNLRSLRNGGHVAHP